MLLILPVLLAGCSGDSDSLPGRPDGRELKKSVEEGRMLELKKHPVVRLGISGENTSGLRELEEKCEKNGWRLEIVKCPGKRLRGLLRTGTVDLIPAGGLSDRDAESMGFFPVPPVFLSGNSLIQKKLLP